MRSPGNYLVNVEFSTDVDAEGEVSHTHAVQAPCVLQLVLPPFCCNCLRFPISEVQRELLSDRFCGEKSAIDVECYDDVVSSRNHCGEYNSVCSWAVNLTG